MALEKIPLKDLITHINTISNATVNMSDFAHFSDILSNKRTLKSKILVFSGNKNKTFANGGKVMFGKYEWEYAYGNNKVY